MHMQASPPLRRWEKLGSFLYWVIRHDLPLWHKRRIAEKDRLDFIDEVCAMEAQSIDNEWKRINHV